MKFCLPILASFLLVCSAQTPADPSQKAFLVAQEKASELASTVSEKAGALQRGIFAARAIEVDTFVIETEFQGLAADFGKCSRRNFLAQLVADLAEIDDTVTFDLAKKIIDANIEDLGRIDSVLNRLQTTLDKRVGECLDRP